MVSSVLLVQHRGLLKQEVMVSKSGRVARDMYAGRELQIWLKVSYKSLYDIQP